jgi:NAD(P)-dependent dehydrogenase (short-subunit alcohol dehydrogenase family)
VAASSPKILLTEAPRWWSNDIDGHAGEETVRRIHAAGDVATFVKADVSVEADVAALVGAAVGTYGQPGGLSPPGGRARGEGCGPPS